MKRKKTLRILKIIKKTREILKNYRLDDEEIKILEKILDNAFTELNSYEKIKDYDKLKSLTERLEKVNYE